MLCKNSLGRRGDRRGTRRTRSVPVPLTQICRLPVVRPQVRTMHPERRQINRVRPVQCITAGAGDMQYYRRVTNGVRLEYTRSWFYTTVNAYYQYGQTVGSKKIQAYYRQPEISANTGRILFRLGAEILSGRKRTTSNDVFASFVPRIMAGKWLGTR